MNDVQNDPLQRLKVYTTTSENYQPVFSRFMASFKHSGLQEDNLFALHYTLAEGQYGCGTPSWYEALRRKIIFYCEQMKSLRSDEVGLFTDADVQFFPNKDVFRQVLHAFSSSGLDMLFMQEGPNEEHANSGFFFAINSPGAFRILNLTREQLGEPGAPLRSGQDLIDNGEDQNVINRLLRQASPTKGISETGFAWDLLSAKHTVFGPYVPPDDMWAQVFVHHATWAPTVDAKVQQMDQVRQKFETWRQRHKN